MQYFEVVSHVSIIVAHPFAASLLRTTSDEGIPGVQLVTCGQPRLCNRAFAAFFNATVLSFGVKGRPCREEDRDYDVHLPSLKISMFIDRLTKVLCMPHLLAYSELMGT